MTCRCSFVFCHDMSYSLFCVFCLSSMRCVSIDDAADSPFPSFLSFPFISIILCIVSYHLLSSERKGTHTCRQNEALVTNRQDEISSSDFLPIFPSFSSNIFLRSAYLHSLVIKFLAVDEYWPCHRHRPYRRTLCTKSTAAESWIIF